MGQLSIIEVFLIGIGLAMDAFAVAVCKGLSMKKVNHGHALLIGIFFGGFQAIMPLIGFYLGSYFEQYITSIDHWIAFILLVFIGVNMIREGLASKEDVEVVEEVGLDIKEMIVLSIATSIDALAVGITFAFMQVKILSAVGLIGFTTLVLSVIGVFLGNMFGVCYKNKAEIAGGVVLISIGLKILLEGLEIVSF